MLRGGFAAEPAKPRAVFLQAGGAHHRGENLVIVQKFGFGVQLLFGDVVALELGRLGRGGHRGIRAAAADQHPHLRFVRGSYQPVNQDRNQNAAEPQQNQAALPKENGRQVAKGWLRGARHSRNQLQFFAHGRCKLLVLSLQNCEGLA